MAFSNASRVRMSLGKTPRLSTSMISSPASLPIAFLRASVAGGEAEPIGESPMNSIAMAIVFAVYWPPHAPAPGQATFSSAMSSSSLILPAALAPIAS
jgi:hypothetical protein